MTPLPSPQVPGQAEDKMREGNQEREPNKKRKTCKETPLTSFGNNNKVYSQQQQKNKLFTPTPETISLSTTRYLTQIFFFVCFSLFFVVEFHLCLFVYFIYYGSANEGKFFLVFTYLVFVTLLQLFDRICFLSLVNSLLYYLNVSLYVNTIIG